MKKLIYSTIVLASFTLAIIVFQISCQKEAVGKSNTVQNKFLYFLGNGGSSPNEYWVCNIDGSNRQQISITMPSGYSIGGDGKLTVDGTTLIFTGFQSSTLLGAVFSVSINGGTAKKLFDTVYINTGGTEIEQTF